MASGDVKNVYRASSNLTVTNLHSIATSSTWVAGWESAVIDNTSNLDLDILLSGIIALGNSATAGQIRTYIVPITDDTPTYAPPFDGTESVETIGDVTLRDSAAVLLHAVTTRADPGTDDVYYLAPKSIAAIFGGSLPRKFVVFVTHNTGVNLAASGNQITLQPQYLNVAP